MSECPYQNNNRQKLSDQELISKLNIITNYDLNLKIRYIPEKPPNLPNIPFDKQYINGETYPWFSNIIPSEIYQPNVDPSNVPNGDGYDKFRSVQYALLFYLGIDMFTIKPDDPNLSVFITNLRDRGPDNYRKKIYMSAITCDKMQYYQEKINTFLNEFYAQITTYSRPVLSSFRRSLLKFFLAMHVGYDDYPDYVIKYFENFIDIVGYGDPRHPHRDEVMIWGYKNIDKVREYFSKRNEIIKQTQDKTSIIYHWYQAGLDPEGLVMEAIHNIVAFSQFNNVVYLIINDKYNGTRVPFNPGYIKYDFLTKFKRASDDTERLDLVRELYRLLTPNNMSISRVEQEILDDPSIIIQSRHIHKLIMASTEGDTYFKYDTSRYDLYHTNFNQCAEKNSGRPIDNFDPEENFITSTIDDETLIPKDNDKIIPVFPEPLYMPFGLGYRRCPGEVLVYFITIKLLNKIKNLEFEFKQPGKDYKLITLGPLTAVPDNIFNIKF